MVDYTEEELAELKGFINTLGLNLPEDRMTYVWYNYRRITNSTEPQPCSCQSSAGLWIKAIQVLKDFVKDKE